jgi:hypothetical protein
LRRYGIAGVPPALSAQREKPFYLAKKNARLRRVAGETPAIR